MMRKNSNHEQLSSGQEKEIQALNMAIHLNMALCHLKQNKLDRVVDDCNKVLQLDSNNIKALFRRGQAYLQLRDSDKAAEDLNKAASLDPADKAIQAEIRRLKAFEKAHYERRKEAMKGFFERLSFEAEEKASEASTTEQPSPQDE